MFVYRSLLTSFQLVTEMCFHAIILCNHGGNFVVKVVRSGTCI